VRIISTDSNLNGLVWDEEIIEVVSDAVTYALTVSPNQWNITE
jgi:hypothetical protein